MKSHELNKKDRARSINRLRKEIKRLNEEALLSKITENKTENMTEIAEPIEAKGVQPSTEATASSSFNPFNEPVKERSYTKDMIQADLGQSGITVSNESIPEPTYDIPSYSDSSSNSQSISQSSPSNSGNSSDSNNGGDSGASTAEPISSNPAAEDLDPVQKRKAAKQTAEVILASYQKFAPIPFVKIASFNMNKLNKLSMSGELDLNMVIMDDGTTVGSHAENVNTQVVELFKVTEDMKNELREPLIDVLMEQSLVLTPVQRLGIAVGGQLVQFTVQAIQLGYQNREALNTFKEWKADKGGYATAPHPAPKHQSPPTNHSTTTETVSEEFVPNEPDYAPPSDDVPSSLEKTKDEPNYDPPTMDVDEYINN